MQTITVLFDSLEDLEKFKNTDWSKIKPTGLSSVDDIDFKPKNKSHDTFLLLNKLSAIINELDEHNKTATTPIILEYNELTKIHGIKYDKN